MTHNVCQYNLPSLVSACVKTKVVSNQNYSKLIRVYSAEVTLAETQRQRRAEIQRELVETKSMGRDRDLKKKLKKKRKKFIKLYMK